jgi:NADPH-dependent ferric siderophore reductase
MNLTAFYLYLKFFLLSFVLLLNPFMSSLVDNLAKNFFHKATVTYRQQIAPHVYHIRIQSDTLKSHHYIPGEHLRLFVGLDRDTALDSKLRTYSIWAFDKAKGTADIAICIHSSGIGARWGKDVRVGDDIHYMGPKGKLTIDYTAESHLLIADPSALSHMYAIKRSVSSDKVTFGIGYAADIADHYADIDGGKPFQFMRLDHDPTDALIAAANALKNSLTDSPVIYLGGDARVCKTLGRYFRQHWPQATVISKGFWMPGKTGMD